MPEFQSFEPNAEISGKIALALVTNIKGQDIRDILVKNQMDRIDTSKWYPLQSMLNVLHDVSEGYNYSESFVAIGMETGKVRVDMLPAESLQQSLSEYLSDYGRFYPQSYRNGYVGYISTAVVDEDHLIIRSQTPYPDDLIYGVLYTLVRQHCATHRKQFILEYDPEMRRDGGTEETIYHVWIE